MSETIKEETAEAVQAEPQGLTLEKFEEATEVVSKVISETKLVYSEYFSNLTGNKVYLKPENMQDTTDLKYLAQVASSILGQDSYSQVFYTDGYYYVDANGVKLKYPMPLEQIISSVQTGVNTSNMESSYMKGISLNEVNGKRVLAYEANPKKLNKNVKEALGTVMNTLGTDVNLDMNIQEMKGAYVLDDNDYIIYMTNYIVYNMEVLDQPMTCITLMETEVQNPGEPVVVTLPSTDGYEDLIGLYDGVIESEVE